MILLVALNLIFVTPASAASYDSQVISSINVARHNGHMCGSTWYPPVKPIVRNTKLSRSALNHSKDMAQRNYFAHSRSGSTLKSRYKKVHYRWRHAGEIIAAGQPTPERVVQAWLDSPSHCRQIMNSRYRNAGLGVYVLGSSRYRTYWTVDFGRQR